MKALETYGITDEMIEFSYRLFEKGNKYYEKVYSFLCDLKEKETESKDLSFKQLNWLLEISEDLNTKLFYGTFEI